MSQGVVVTYNKGYAPLPNPQLSVISPESFADADGLSILAPGDIDWDKFIEELKKKIGEKALEKLISELGGQSVKDAKDACDRMKCNNEPRDDNWVLTCYTCSVWDCMMKKPAGTIAVDNCLKANYSKCLSRLAPWDVTVPKIPDPPKKPEGGL